MPSQLSPPDLGLRRNRSYNTLRREFDLWDAADFIKSGVEVKHLIFFFKCLNLNNIMHDFYLFFNLSQSSNCSEYML